MPERDIYIGLDAGGTRSRAVAGDAGGRLIRRYEAAGANPRVLGVPEAADRLAALLQTTCGTDHLKGLVLGVAGAGSTSDQERLHTAVRVAWRQHTGQVLPPCEIMSDIDLTVDTALGQNPGLVVIAGTGSIVQGQDLHGHQVRRGGWGPVLGDEGGGMALGTAALRAVAHALDGGPATTLRTLVADHLDVHSRSDLLDLVYTTDWPRQRAAPLLLKAASQQDEVATHILSRHLKVLVRQVLSVAEHLTQVPAVVTLAGGLTSHPTWEQSFRRLLNKSTSLAWTTRPLPRSPERHAYDRARTQA